MSATNSQITSAIVPMMVTTNVAAITNSTHNERRRVCDRSSRSAWMSRMLRMFGL